MRGIRDKQFEIVERSSGYWIVGDYGVAWSDPFDDYEDAIAKLHELNGDDLRWIGVTGLCEDVNYIEEFEKGEQNYE